MTARDTILTICLVAGAWAAGLSAARAGALASAHPGGYGPIRLDMPEAAAKGALAGIAKDVALLSMAAMDNDDEAAMAKMVVSVPWEDTYVGTIDPTTRIQFGVHGGRVVSVNLRTKLAPQGTQCQDAFAAMVRRHQAEFGPIQIAEMPGGLDKFANGTANFAGWQLGLSRMETQSGTCNLMADYDSDSETGIEADWRAGRR